MFFILNKNLINLIYILTEDSLCNNIQRFYNKFMKIFQAVCIHFTEMFFVVKHFTSSESRTHKIYIISISS